jgi:hypothetical protein
MRIVRTEMKFDIIIIYYMTLFSNKDYIASNERVISEW